VASSVLESQASSERTEVFFVGVAGCDQLFDGRVCYDIIGATSEVDLLGSWEDGEFADQVEPETAVRSSIKVDLRHGAGAPLSSCEVPWCLSLLERRDPKLCDNAMQHSGAMSKLHPTQ
jgi:hypothetical protein